MPDDSYPTARRGDPARIEATPHRGLPARAGASNAGYSEAFGIATCLRKCFLWVDRAPKALAMTPFSKGAFEHGLR